MGDVGGTIRSAAEHYGRFKAAYDGKNDSEAATQLGRLKGLFVLLPTYLDPTAESPTKVQEVMLVRDTLEHAVLLSARQSDLDAFEVYVQQLKLYYKDIADVKIPESERRMLILALNLLRLLVSSKISEFHSELATIPHADHSHLFIRLPISLERYLMEGSYNRLLNARNQVPSPEFLPLMQMLEQTVRNEIAVCLPRSYSELSLSEAAKLLMMSSAEEVMETGKALGWPLSDDGKSFLFSKAADSAASVRGEGIAYKAVLAEHLQFATQLQRVV